MQGAQPELITTIKIKICYTVIIMHSAENKPQYLGVDVEGVGTLKRFVLRLRVVEQKPFLHDEESGEIG